MFPNASFAANHARTLPARDAAALSRGISRACASLSTGPAPRQPAPKTAPTRPAVDTLTRSEIAGFIDEAKRGGKLEDLATALGQYATTTDETELAKIAGAIRKTFKQPV